MSLKLDQRHLNILRIKEMQTLLKGSSRLGDMQASVSGEKG